MVIKRVPSKAYSELNTKPNLLLLASLSLRTFIFDLCPMIGNI